MTDSLGKYRIAAEIGKGGFATVYRALDTTLDREVALKVLDPLLMREPGWVTRFQREARAVARLKHPHIVTIYEIGEVEGRLFIAMELIEGAGLDAEIARRGRIPWDEALALLGQVADALDYAHAQGVLHRDLKPANILLDPRRGAVLTDFGFARLVGESSMSVSVSGGMVGTPAYIAPEIWEDQEPVAQSDVYALGCIAYEMLIGEILFAGKTPMGVMAKHAAGPVLPERWPGGVPGRVAPALLRAVARQPADRYGSAAEFVAALGQAARTDLSQGASGQGAAPKVMLSGSSGPSRAAESDQRSISLREPPGSGSAPNAAQPRSGRGWLFAGAVGLIVVALGLGFWVRSCSTPPPAPQIIEKVVTQGITQPPQTTEEVVAQAPTQPPQVATEPPMPVATEPPPPLAAQPPTEPAPTPAPAAGATWTSPADGMLQVYVPAGQFLMGSADSDGDAYPVEKPQRSVYLDAYWIDRTEVTKEQYQRCVAAGRCVAPKCTGTGVGNHPVVCVNRQDAASYCGWAGRRLPTESEWEKAARGTDGRLYPWGNHGVTGGLLNFCDGSCAESWKNNAVNDGYGTTAPVGTFSGGASPYGALDMAGNVSEWVADSDRVRGGSWYDTRLMVRVASSFGRMPGDADGIVGFRCARS
jgi:eukaryotic-like serine/threonine-protein kinase